MANILRVFGIGANGILAKGVSVPATVSQVRRSRLYVIKKPVRLYVNDSNTRLSHFIHFTYRVNGVDYSGKLFITPHYRCPAKGETITVYYDPEKPQNYACYAFGPAEPLTGWY